MTRLGLEQYGNSRDFIAPANKSVQNPVQFMPVAVQTASPADALEADLARLIAAWPTLSEATRRAIVRLTAGA